MLAMGGDQYFFSLSAFRIQGSLVDPEALE
jgi:hypothetical protein